MMRLNGNKGGSRADVWKRVFRAEETAVAKALGQQHLGIKKRSVCLGNSEPDQWT